MLQIKITSNGRQPGNIMCLISQQALIILKFQAEALLTIPKITKSGISQQLLVGFNSKVELVSYI